MLHFLQRDVNCGHFLDVEVLKSGQPGVNAGTGLALAIAVSAQQLLGLYLQLTEIGAWG